MKELAKELRQQKEEKEKDEEPPPKSIKTSNLQHILSAMEALSVELCEIDHDWEQSVNVLMASIGSYPEILKERKRKSW